MITFKHPPGEITDHFGDQSFPAIECTSSKEKYNQDNTNKKVGLTAHPTYEIILPLNVDRRANINLNAAKHKHFKMCISNTQ